MTGRKKTDTPENERIPEVGSYLTIAMTPLAEELFDRGLKLFFNEKPDEGCELFHMSADLGNANAMAHLGVAYFTGTGVEVDEQESLKWFRAASELGNPMADLRLGYAFLHGAGERVDLVRAEELLIRASKKLVGAWYSLSTLYIKRGDISKMQHAMVTGARLEDVFCTFYMASWIANELVVSARPMRCISLCAVDMLLRSLRHLLSTHRRAMSEVKLYDPDDEMMNVMADGLWRAIEDVEVIRWRKAIPGIADCLDAYFAVKGDVNEVQRFPRNLIEVLHEVPELCPDD